jgi:hypothetical protein
MPLVLDAVALRDLARGLRLLARRQREDAERLAHHSLGRNFRDLAEVNERRAAALEQLAATGLVFDLRRRC